MTGSESLVHDRAQWQRYQIRIACKVLSEFCHERSLRPAEISPGEYSVRSDDGLTEYRFRAEVLALESWNIDASTLHRIRDDRQLGVDAVELVTDLSDALGITREALPEYLEEFVNTLTLGANRTASRRIAAADLATADFQTIEAAMTEGHPCLIANAGRLGFGADDIERYAPESGARFPLTWVAVWRDNTDFSALPEIDYDHLVRGELGARTLARFDGVLTGQGLDPRDYYYMPVHRWQWDQKVQRIYAVDIAERKIVLLGAAPDLYQAQQSIRTLFNIGSPRRHYVKLALSIVNMGFTRGMSADYMRTTPAINDWVRRRVGADDYLNSIGFTMLYEVAAIGYRNTTLTAITRPGSEYRKLLSALWRESPVARVGQHEQLTTMAALLHIDHQGVPLVAVLIERSGLAPRDWLDRYLRCYLHPIIYLLYAFELKFSPHGENLILVLDAAVPVRAILKDIGEEVTVFGDGAGLTGACRRVVSEASDGIRALGVLSDVFDDFLRHLAAILHTGGVITDSAFWAVVAASVTEFQRSHPALEDRFQRWDLFAPTFEAIHMNHLQLSDNRRMVDLGDSYAALTDADHVLANPIAGYRPARDRQPTAEAAVS